MAANCGTKDIHDACNTYTCESPNGTAQCSATPVTNGDPCDDDDDSTYPDACTGGQCVGTGKKICIAFSIKHLNW